MSKKRRGNESPLQDQEWFIHENAVALVRERDALIVRLRLRITLLEKGARRRKSLIRGLAERVAAQAEILGRKAEKGA